MQQRGYKCQQPALEPVIAAAPQEPVQGPAIAAAPKPKRTNIFEQLERANVLHAHNPDPTSPDIDVALSGADAERWQSAIDLEITNLEKNQTWTVVERSQIPAGQQVIGSRVILRVKVDSRGVPTRFKARLVARGFNQVVEDPIISTYAPVAMGSTARTL